MLSCASRAGERSAGYMQAVLDLLFEAVNAPTAAAAAELRARAAELMPICVTADEMAALGAAGLVDCDADYGNLCEATCGSLTSYVRSHTLTLALLSHAHSDFPPLSQAIRKVIS
jgi:hypothetical protein